MNRAQTVTIRHMTGMIEVPFRKDITVENFKRLVSAKLEEDNVHVVPERVRLSHKGRFLENGRILDDYNVGSGDTFLVQPVFRRQNEFNHKMRGLNMGKRYNKISSAYAYNDPRHYQVGKPNNGVAPNKGSNRNTRRGGRRQSRRRRSLRRRA